MRERGVESGGKKRWGMASRVRTTRREVEKESESAKERRVREEEKERNEIGKKERGMEKTREG